MTRLLPWALLGLVLVFPLNSQSTSSDLFAVRRAIKLYGEPAASEWVDIQSNQVGQSPSQYIVPSGKVLYLEQVHRRREPIGGHLRARVLVNGQNVTTSGDSAILNANDYDDSFWRGEVAREGQVVQLERTGTGDAPPEAVFYLRGWLEDAF